MKSICYSAPGKVILSGEHSVVYTKPAFVTAVNYRLTCLLQSNSNQSKQDRNESIEYIQSLVLEHLRKQQIPLSQEPYRSTITSTIPQGRGMGSSAAFCVAVCAALLHWFTGKQPGTEEISNLAFAAEKFFHGIPSGVDVSAASYGGLIFYRKEFEFLKTISALNFKLPKCIEDNLILIDSGKPLETTKEMVVHVGKRYNKDPKAIDGALTEIEKITKRMVVSVVKEDADFFKTCIADNQIQLEHLGIVSLETRQLLDSLRPFGVGKVTGAGGVLHGSGLILFYSPAKDALIEHLKKNNISSYGFSQSYEGVQFCNGG